MSADEGGVDVPSIISEDPPVSERKLASSSLPTCEADTKVEALRVTTILNPDALSKIDTSSSETPRCATLAAAASRNALAVGGGVDPEKTFATFRTKSGASVTNNRSASAASSTISMRSASGGEKRDSMSVAKAAVSSGTDIFHLTCPRALGGGGGGGGADGGRLGAGGNRGAPVHCEACAESTHASFAPSSRRPK
jgi:hypothetical protein